ncbi:RNA 3'-terminal phosphate cyclase [Isosphaeraceae bacterium EP7]
MDWLRILAGGNQPQAPVSAKRWVAHDGHGDLASAPHRAPTTREPRGATSMPNNSKIVTLDGSAGEGGGQILRTALTLSMLTGRSFRLTGVRANRSNPGLRPQHLMAVRAAATLCNADVTGDSVGSADLTFRPGTLDPRDLDLDIGTAGSTALVLQTLHLPLATRSDRAVLLRLNGGTFNEAAPSEPFLLSTWKAHLDAIGLPIGLTSPRAGFYPRGSGRLDAWIEPGQPRAIVLDGRGPLTRITGIAGVAGLDRGIADRLKAQAEASLADLGVEIDIRIIEWQASSPGAALSLTAHHGPDSIPATFVGLGRRGLPAESVAGDAVAQLLAFEARDGAVDSHSADQILLPLALAEGRSIYNVTEVTGHLRTNAKTITAFLDRAIDIEEAGDGTGRVVIR